MPKGQKGRVGKRQDLWLSISQVKTLRTLAKKKCLAMSDIVRRALDDYFKKEGVKKDS
jgi:hypothetical protein